MKYLLIAIVAITFASCKKDEVYKQPNEKQTIVSSVLVNQTSDGYNYSISFNKDYYAYVNLLIRFDVYDKNGFYVTTIENIIGVPETKTLSVPFKYNFNSGDNIRYIDVIFIPLTNEYNFINQ